MSLYFFYTFSFEAKNNNPFILLKCEMKSHHFH
jgi:hypothetical protein